jgi:methionine-S-sulfoxide reductase
MITWMLVFKGPIRFFSSLASAQMHRASRVKQVGHLGAWCFRVPILILAIICSPVLGVKSMKKQVAVLAGGCFWGVEELFRSQKGVLQTEVGYTGGVTLNPTYEQVKTGQTGHAEAIRIEFDAEKTSYSEILKYFFKIHDPTTQDRQGNDIGTQYRSAIFYSDESQKKIAVETLKEFEKAKFWGKPLVTQVLPAGPFYSAENYHQDYLQKNPGGYTCHYERKF